jgi:hypothetical protein
VTQDLVRDTRESAADLARLPFDGITEDHRGEAGTSRHVGRRFQRHLRRRHDGIVDAGKQRIAGLRRLGVA